MVIETNFKTENSIKTFFIKKTIDQTISFLKDLNTLTTCVMKDADKFYLKLF